MQLMDLIQSKYRIISVVGMAKNAGKTMTLNALIDEAMERNIRLGITSTGRDGEKQDIVTSTEKPLIYVAEGTLIATTEETFKCSEVRMEILEVTDFSTSMGRVVIAQAKNGGYVQIAGPNTNGEMKEVGQKLLFYGAQLVIVDGAIDRVASASPAVTEATILATGAVLSRDMNQVIERSIHQTRLFSLPRVEDEHIRQMISAMIEEKGYYLIDEEGYAVPLEIKTALNSGNIIGRAIEEKTKYVVIGGSLVSKTLKDIVVTTQKYRQVVFVVKDATKIFIDSRDYLYFEKIGIQIQVVDKIKAVAVTVNPYAPQGYYFNPEEFRHKMEQFLDPIPVFDVVLGGDA
ncbi:hypothetical protein SAMN02745975_02695 [Geosporobacter subterraneus DSM 17957]|uniref:Molybdopterin-guanine dinucleotide biosynthesis protein n=1 Tax=Geosporobacter subterraneus DSM 17957 TaxID=1121919 RepID=A0A1M6LJR5_9FIRM|nr:hypothetical protein [Geosporobacter subterraneus]SHJ71436.1 hypothetical protein SAMN02745975_02695 [Geosporobacter subterraneus DSM 17957]